MSSCSGYCDHALAEVSLKNGSRRAVERRRPAGHPGVGHDEQTWSLRRNPNPNRVGLHGAVLRGPERLTFLELAERIRRQFDVNTRIDLGEPSRLRRVVDQRLRIGDDVRPRQRPGVNLDLISLALPNARFGNRPVESRPVRTRDDEVHVHTFEHRSPDHQLAQGLARTESFGPRALP